MLKSASKKPHMHKIGARRFIRPRVSRMCMTSGPGDLAASLLRIRRPIVTLRTPRTNCQCDSPGSRADACAWLVRTHGTCSLIRASYIMMAFSNVLYMYSHRRSPFVVDLRFASPAQPRHQPTLVTDLRHATRSDAHYIASTSVVCNKT